MSERIYSNGEIDLLQLMIRFGKALSRVFRSIGRSFIVLLVFIIRKWLILGLSLIMGIIISMLLSDFAKGIYSSEFILRNNLANNTEMISHVERLSGMIESDDYDNLRGMLNIPELDSGSLIDIRAYWVIDRNRDGTPDYIDYYEKYNVYDTNDVRMRDRLAIVVSTRDVTQQKPLMNGVIDYINNYNLFVKQNDLRLAHYGELIDKYSYEIDQLDSLQIEMSYNKRLDINSFPGQILFLQEREIPLLYNDINDLIRMKQRLEIEREIYFKPVTLLVEPDRAALKVNTTMYYARWIVPSIFGLVILLLAAIKNKSYLKEIFKKY